MQDTIRLLQQITVEDEQSRKQIRKLVEADIKTSEGLADIYMMCAHAIRKYIDASEHYYDSKKARVEALEEWNVHDLAIELAIAVVPFTDPTPIQTAASALAKSFKYKDYFDGIKTAAELYAVCVETGLYDMYPPGDIMESLSIKSLFSLNQETLDMIAKTKFLDPMLVPPKPWTNNNDGGYLTIQNHILLGKNKHQYQTEYEAINLLQGVELELDENILMYEEESNKELDTYEKIEAHNQLVRNSKASYNNILEAGNSFYFMYQADFRGRKYVHGYQINLQSNKYKKALISLKEKHLITE